MVSKLATDGKSREEAFRKLNERMKVRFEQNEQIEREKHIETGKHLIKLVQDLNLITRYFH